MSFEKQMQAEALAKLQKLSPHEQKATVVSAKLKAVRAEKPFSEQRLARAKLKWKALSPESQARVRAVHEKLMAILAKEK